jgi:GxxExxY protein
MIIEEELTNAIIGGAIEVHREFGPGLLESAYEQCLRHELKLRGLNVQFQIPLPVLYKGERVDCGYRVDMIVNNAVLLELKAVEHLLPIHEVQLLTYLRLTRIRVGLLINFNVELLKRGIVRRVI